MAFVFVCVRCVHDLVIHWLSSQCIVCTCCFQLKLPSSGFAPGWCVGGRAQACVLCADSASPHTHHIKPDLARQKVCANHVSHMDRVLCPAQVSPLNATEEGPAWEEVLKPLLARTSGLPSRVSRL